MNRTPESLVMKEGSYSLVKNCMETLQRCKIKHTVNDVFNHLFFQKCTWNLLYNPYCFKKSFKRKLHNDLLPNSMHFLFKLPSLYFPKLCSIWTVNNGGR